jgi:perosamine synthetase
MTAVGLPTIPISAVRLGNEEEALVLRVLRSGRLTQGPMVELLESEFARAHGVPHAIAVNNGTTALVAAMEALGIQPGDEVITSPFSFVATLNAILECGGTARFADVHEDFCLDPAAVEALVTPRTRAVLPVHLYGLPADMAGLAAVAQRHGLAIVEDAAQAPGARIDQRRVGSFGVGCFSLYATKNVTAGEGGMVTTEDALLADRLRLLRNQGMRARYQYELIGHNYRMSELQAAVAIPQVRRLDEINGARQRNARTLSAGLAGVPGLVVPTAPESREHVYHQYTIRVTPQAGRTRDELAAGLARLGITTGVYYPRLVHDYDCYRGNPHLTVDPTPRAAAYTSQVLSLPVHPALTAADLERIVLGVRKVLS